MKTYRRLLPIILMVLTACVYAPKEEHYVELDETIIEPKIIVKQLPDNLDTILIWSKTVLQPIFQSTPQKIHGGILSFGGKRYEFTGGKTELVIDPALLLSGTYKLVVELYTHSGTGSIADVSGVEALVLTKEWVVIVEKPNGFTPEIYEPVIENGFLKLSWKPLNKPYFKTYQLILDNNGISNHYSKVIDVANQSSYIDSLFVGGELNIRLKVDYCDVDNSINSSWCNYSYNYPIDFEVFENKDYIAFTWSNPFKYRIYYSRNSGNYAEVHENIESGFMKAAEGIGRPVKHSVAFRPIIDTDYDHQMYQLYKTHAFGKQCHAFTQLMYDQENENYIFKGVGSVERNSKNLELLNSVEHDDTNNAEAITYSLDRKSIWTIMSNQLMQLDAVSLNILDKMQLEVSGIGINMSQFQEMKFVTDTILLIAHKRFFILYDVILKKTVYTLNVDYNYSYSTVSISCDGKYAANCGNDGAFIYKITDTGIGLWHQNKNTYYGCLFSNNQPSILLLSTPEDIKCFDCDNCVVEKTISSPCANPVNFDPVTNNLLLVSNSDNRIYVYDCHKGIVLFEMNHNHSATKIRLINNVIFSKEGYYFNISEYVD